MNMAIMPVRRNLSFKLGKNRVHDWNGNGLHFTQFLNTLSIFFPAGERFFIDSVRNYRDQIDDPELKEAIRNFIGQEGLHSREHIEYNQALVDAGLPVAKYEGYVKVLLDNLKKTLPHNTQLAATCALEHLTAVMAKALLENEHVLGGSDERYKALWEWHALEETEHKGVCFDVYEEVVGKGAGAYTLRVGAFVLANAIFWSLVIPYHVGMVRNRKKQWDIKGWLKHNKMLWGKKGAFRSVIPEWFDYFRPGFHPWDDDNQHVLEYADVLVNKVEQFS